MEKDPAVYIAHVLEAISNIEADILGLDFDAFRHDRRARQLVERNLEMISEASRRPPGPLKQQEPQIPWRAIAGIGNILRHEYHHTYPTVLWDTCKKDLLPLKEAMIRIESRVRESTS